MSVRTVRPEVPEAVAAVVLRCMAREPEQRYATPSEVSAAFARALVPGAAPSGPALRPRTTANNKSRHKNPPRWNPACP